MIGLRESASEIEAAWIAAAFLYWLATGRQHWLAAAPDPLGDGP
jgi:hypothetical protein